MIKRIKKFRIKLSFKIMLAMFILTIIPLTILSLTLQYKTKKFYDSNTKLLYERMSTQYLQNLGYKYNSYYSMVGSVISLGGVRDILNSDAKSFSEIYQEASHISSALSTTRSYYNSNNEMINLMIYSIKDTPPIYTAKIVTYKESLHHDILSEENIKRKYVVWKNSSNKNVISFLYPITPSYRDTKKIIAYIVVDVDADKFFHISDEKYSRYTSQLVATIQDENGKVLWSSEKNKEDHALLYTIKENDVLKQFNLSCTIQFYSDTAPDFNNYRNTILFVTIILLAVNAIIVLLFSKNISKRIKLLMQKMDHVQNGNMSVSTKIPGNDELNTIDDNFNQMVERLNSYIKENFLQKIAYKEAQLNILQNQINPHFLYNTLEVIDSMATTNGNFEICDICNRLGQIFRYNVSRSGREFVAFMDELNHVKNYAAIQKIRFSDRFTIVYDIDPDCYRVKMLKFILQPLVENAIVHALEKKEDGGILSISAKMQEKLIIEISDNGCGFDVQTLKEINEFIDAPLDHNHVDFSGGIGLKNVITRIKLVYGEEASIVINSDSSGTNIILNLQDMNLR